MCYIIYIPAGTGSRPVNIISQKFDPPPSPKNDLIKLTLYLPIAVAEIIYTVIERMRTSYNQLPWL